MSVIIYGPQGCGKTSNAKALAQHLGVGNIKDNWKPGDKLPEDTLALTNVENVPEVLDFYEVRAVMADSSVSTWPREF
ncbi:MAG: AAA family ATPase [Gammaproteobacteria bacterium]|nr:MAG: AAA family ATPase [Gammaproteobacteria bacterium]